MIIHLPVQVTAKSIPNLDWISDCGLRIADLVFRIEIIPFVNMYSVMAHL
jgi:hypothetical protein